MKVPNTLQKLFVAELLYVPKMPPTVSAEGRIGKLVGSGEGRIEGEKIRGRINWSLFEVVGNPCQTNLAGVIHTEDGAKVNLESTGYGLIPDKTADNKWHMAATLKFSAQDQRYAWLNRLIAVWDGAFDMATGRHLYKAYAKSL